MRLVGLAIYPRVKLQICGVPVEGRREGCLSGGDGGAMWAERRD